MSDEKCDFLGWGFPKPKCDPEQVAAKDADALRRQLAAATACNAYGETPLAEVERLRAELATMTTRAEAAEAMLDKLSKTADGVCPAPGDELWYYSPDSSGRSSLCSIRAAGQPRAEWLINDKWKCYSTRKAAEAAAAAEKGEGIRLSEDEQQALGALWDEGKRKKSHLFTDKPRATEKEMP